MSVNKRSERSVASDGASDGSEGSEGSESSMVITQEEMKGLLEELGDLDDTGGFVIDYNIVTDPTPRQDLLLPKLVSHASGVHYLNMEHFLYYLEYVTNEIYYDNMLVYPMASDYKNMLIMNFKDQKFDTSTHIANLLQKANTRFIVLPVGLYFPNVTSDYLSTPGSVARVGHANLLVIDNELEHIEFFEPHGETFGHAIGDLMDIPHLLHNFLGRINDKFNDYDFINVSENCLLGLQEVQNLHESVGHCLAWTMMYLHLRLLNPQLASDSIIQRFTNNFSIPEQILILKMYIATIEDYYYTNEQEYLVPASVKFENSPESIEIMTSRLMNLAVQYKYLLQIRNFVQAGYLFEELLMYRHLPMFHEALRFLVEP